MMISYCTNLGLLSHVVCTSSFDDCGNNGISVQIFCSGESEFRVEISEDFFEGSFVYTHVTLDHDWEFVWSFDVIKKFVDITTSRTTASYALFACIIISKE